MKNHSLFLRIRQIVRQIPPGRVTTYGQLAKFLEFSDARIVGWALHGNSDKTIPCHRVVQKNGTLSPTFSLGGWREQRRRLETEGLRFRHRQIVHFYKVFWSPI